VVAREGYRFRTKITKCRIPRNEGNTGGGVLDVCNSGVFDGSHLICLSPPVRWGTLEMPDENAPEHRTSNTCLAPGVFTVLCAQCKTISYILVHETEKTIFQIFTGGREWA
jgi:hypothetical protein